MTLASRKREITAESLRNPTTERTPIKLPVLLLLASEVEHSPSWRSPFTTWKVSIEHNIHVIKLFYDGNIVYEAGERMEGGKFPFLSRCFTFGARIYGFKAVYLIIIFFVEIAFVAVERGEHWARSRRGGASPALVFVVAFLLMIGEG